jgi:hypothetical protein
MISLSDRWIQSLMGPLLAKTPSESKLENSDMDIKFLSVREIQPPPVS